VFWRLANAGRRAERSIMVDSIGALVGQAPQEPLVWETTRASLAYIRDTAQISRGDGDLLDPLIFTAVLDANMAPVNRDPELQVIYGGDIAAPDELRRPVSINAVAQSLSLPFETVRRRVGGLARAGLCVLEPRGVIVPRAAVSSPAYNMIQRARYDRARRFYQVLKTAGALPGDSAANAQTPTAGPLVRAADRALSSYMLRACNDLIALTSDVLRTLILVELTLDNIGELATVDLPRWAADPAGLARPVRVAALAQQLRVAPETTRRHVLALEGTGFADRVGPGFIAVAPPAIWPELVRLVEVNLANVQRLFAALRSLDVLAAWDTPDAAWRAAERAAG
jgi:DNA-binding Lrp family transcriptional regulator